MRHPPREGVDWNKARKWNNLIHCVTLHARVWIETTTTDVNIIDVRSHPPREGVDWNSLAHSEHHAPTESPSTRGCGLKQQLPMWISSMWEGHPPREGVDWNMLAQAIFIASLSHPPREGVDWNSVHTFVLVEALGHPPREGVDWNIRGNRVAAKRGVTLHARVWIETFFFC